MIRASYFENDSRVAHSTREQGSTPAMPYMPYWFESFGPCLPWVVPCIAITGLWFAKSSENIHLKRTAERVFYAAMLLVAWVALRTVLANEGCWLIHMASIGAMVLGATFPVGGTTNSELENEIGVCDL